MARTKGNPPKRERRKPKTAAHRGKRYRCCICRRRAPTKTTEVPYYCSEHTALRETRGHVEAEAPVIAIRSD